MKNVFIIIALILLFFQIALAVKPSGILSKDIAAATDEQFGNLQVQLASEVRSMLKNLILLKTKSEL